MKAPRVVSPADRKNRKRVLHSHVYIEATIFADIFCDPAARADCPPEVHELIALAFKELAALVGVPAPAFAWTPRAWKKARASFVETFRAAHLLCEEAGLEDRPHQDNVDRLDPYTVTGRAARIAAWLGFTLWGFHMKDKYGCALFKTDERRNRLDELRAAVAWAGRIERYGAEAVRRAKECRARMVTDALEAARASVPDVDTLLRETGTPDVDAALYSELGDELQKFINEEGGQS